LVEEAKSKRTSKLLIVDRTKRTHLGGSKVSEITVGKGKEEGVLIGGSVGNPFAENG